MDTKTKAEDILCPICGNPVHVYGPEDWTPSFTDPDSGGDPVNYVCDCGFSFCVNSYSYEETKQAFYRTARIKKIKESAFMLIGETIWTLHATQTDCTDGLYSYEIYPVKRKISEVRVKEDPFHTRGTFLSIVANGYEYQLNGNEFVSSNCGIAGRCYKATFNKGELRSEALALKAAIEQEYKKVRTVTISSKCLD